jgi:hypothetical protein
MEARIKDIHCGVINNLNIITNERQEAINYIQEKGSIIIVDEIPSFGSCGFSWSGSGNLDLYLKINTAYRSFTVDYNSLDELMQHIGPITYVTTDSNITYEETNLDRILYVIHKLPIERKLQRLIRKDLLQLRKIRKLDIIPTKQISPNSYHQLITKLFSWLDSKRCSKSIFYSNIDDLFRDYVKNNPQVMTEPIPYVTR